MYQTKEQLMSDIALLIKAHDQKSFKINSFVKKNKR